MQTLLDVFRMPFLQAKTARLLPSVHMIADRGAGLLPEHGGTLTLRLCLIFQLPACLSAALFRCVCGGSSYVLKAPSASPA